jgi:phage-related protein (TIGR01555 family)
MSLLEAAQAMRSRKAPIQPLVIYDPPPNVLPKGGKMSLAMDSAITEQSAWVNAQIAAPIMSGVLSEGLLFYGYAYLSLLAQRAEYRIPTEIIATEMTRKWVKFKVAEDAIKKRQRHRREEEKAEEELQPTGEEPESTPGEHPDSDGGVSAQDAEPLTQHINLNISGDPGEEEADEGVEEEEERVEEEENAEEDEREEKKAANLQEDDDKAERLKELEKEFDRLGVRDCFKHIAMDDGYFGRAHLFMDFSEDEDEVDQLRGEMNTDIGDGRNDISLEKVTKGSLKRIKVIEPTWTYPTTYNSINPLRDDWYKPTVWYVMGMEIHTSRLLTFIGRPVPDMLKPSYMFGGLSLSQLVKPYVDLWLNTRQNIGNLIQAFSVMVLKTNLSATLETGGGEMFERAELFNQGRDNAGLMMVDMKTEDFENVAVPLGGLDHLQAQAQEHMMSVVRIPAVKFTGIQPSGLNASSEGEIRTFYDTIGAYQESLFRPNLTKVMHFVMLSLWGEIDEDITFDFAPLWALTEKEEAEVRKMEAETDDILVNGVAALRPEEVRERIASDPDTPYSGLDVEDVPDPPQLQEQGLATGGKVNIKGTQGFGGGPGGKAPGNGE